MIGWFEASDYVVGSATWNNKVVGQLNADTTTDVSKTTSTNSNGTEETFEYLSGGESSQVMLNATPFNGSTNKEYTFIHICRYTSSDQDTHGRIWQGVGVSQSSGFWYRHSNRFQQGSGGGILGTGMNNVTNWLLTIDQNLSLGGKVKTFYYEDSDSEYVNNTITTGGNSLANLTNLSINNGFSTGNDETSEWGCALALMYNRHLSDIEIEDVKSHLIANYF